MLVMLKKDAPVSEIERIKSFAGSKGLRVDESYGEDFIVLGFLGNTASVDPNDLKASPWVENVQRISAPYKLANRQFHPEDSIIDVAGIKIGGNEKVAIMAGPCSIESREHTLMMAEYVEKAGADMLRGGAYKPRTSPYAFQGLGTRGIEYMCEAREKYNLPIVSELMDADQIDEFENNVDLIQIGARNMQNFTLLKKIGQRTTKPVLLKRGMSATIEEWLMSAEYIMANGNKNVILCERGVRSFEKYTRNMMDLAVVPIIKQRSHLPIVIDPSHATGDWRLVESVSLAAIAAGADGLIIETHNDPKHAMSDGAQCLYPEQLKSLIEKGSKIAEVIGRKTK